MDDPWMWIGIGFAIVLTAAMVLSLADIFFYNNRKAQLKWLKGTMVVQVIALGTGLGIYVSLGGFGTYLWDESIGILLLLAALVFQLFAHRKIKQDEELVKSMDRIR